MRIIKVTLALSLSIFIVSSSSWAKTTKKIKFDGILSAYSKKWPLPQDSRVHCTDVKNELTIAQKRCVGQIVEKAISKSFGNISAKIKLPKDISADNLYVPENTAEMSFWSRLSNQKWFDFSVYENVNNRRVASGGIYVTFETIRDIERKTCELECFMGKNNTSEELMKLDFDEITFNYYIVEKPK